VEPSVLSPFTFLLVLAPVHNGQIQFFYVHLWFVLIHCAAALFAYWFFRDLGCSEGPSVVAALLFATMGFYGNTEWPHHLVPAIWAPLIFLFLLRSLNGRAPLKSAAWSGVMLGLSWLSGHHAPPVILTLAVAAVGLAAVAPRAQRRPIALRMAVLFSVMVLVSAVQVLPTLEYGKVANRWTATGVLTWKDKVEYPEHEQFSLRPSDLLHLVMPNGQGLFSDPFVGTVALSLAAIGIWGGFRRREVRMFVLLAIGGLLYAMARSSALYGPLYVFAPLVEKTREPMVALCLFQFALAALAAIGAELLIASPDPGRETKVIRVLLWFGIGTFVVLALLACLKPAVTSVVLDGDPRPVMIALLALLLAGLYHAWSRGLLRRQWALALLGLLAIAEQSNEVGWGWAHIRDAGRMGIVNALTDTRDIGAWLRWWPSPKRIATESKDIAFNVGDWYRVDASNAYTAGMFTSTFELGWWQDRLVQMYGIGLVVSRAPTRANQHELFQGSSGLKIFANPDAFPRAWTVHDIILAPDEKSGAAMVREWNFDLRKTALLVKTMPQLDRCGGEDKVDSIVDKPSYVRVAVEMACKGLVVVSDNDYPGWHAEVDGKSAPIWNVNTVIRGVVVGPGRHQLVMKYRPFSVYFGFGCTLAGLAVAVFLQRRNEDGAG
jgi:hypothetical protein